MRYVELNVAQQVVQPVESAYSSDGLGGIVVTVAVAAPRTELINFIPTVHARELVVIAQATVPMTLTIDLVSVNGIADITVSTVALLVGTPARVVVTGLTAGARVYAALVGAVPGTCTAAAYARA